MLPIVQIEPSIGITKVRTTAHISPLLIAVLIFLVPARNYAADAFRRLAAPEIRAKIVGNVVTDDSHWSDGYAPNGTLKGMELGQVKPGAWKLQGNEMCVTRRARKPVKECFEIWMAKDRIEYRRDGITLTSGLLRQE